MALSDEGEVFMDAGSGDEAEHNDIDDIKKNLLSDLSDDSPVKLSGSDSMPPPPAPVDTSSSDKMRVFLRIRPLKPDESANGENQVKF